MAQRDYSSINDYNRGTYDKLTIMVPKGRKAEIKRYADAHGVSMTKLIIDALESYCKLNLARQDGE